jgi:hypothetical protein
MISSPIYLSFVDLGIEIQSNSRVANALIVAIFPRRRTLKRRDLVYQVTE